jgi:hypothetical protein
VFEKTRVAGHHTTRRLMHIGPHDSVPGAVANTAPRARSRLKKKKKGVFVACTRGRTWVRFRCLERHSMTISHSRNGDSRTSLSWPEPARSRPLSYADSAVLKKIGRSFLFPICAIEVAAQCLWRLAERLRIPTQNFNAKRILALRKIFLSFQLVFSRWPQNLAHCIAVNLVLF